MKKTKKLLSVILSICMLLSISTVTNLTAEAAMTTRDNVITSNVNKIKSYIKQNGFINGLGEYTIQKYLNDEKYDEYFLMYIEKGSEKLVFQFNSQDATTDKLIEVLKLNLAEPTQSIKTLKACAYDGVDEYPVAGGYAYVGENYDAEESMVAFYIDYNYSAASDYDTKEMFEASCEYSFIIWNEMLNDELGMNLGAIGFTKYCTEHTWNSGEITKKSTPTATGVKTYTCTLCGTTKTASIPKCAKYDNPMTAKGKTATLKYAKLKTKKLTLASKKIIKLSKAQGTVTYKKTSGNKKISVNKKTGKITVEKGLKKGTYKVKIKVTAAGNASYKAKVKTVTVKIKVK